MGHGHHQLDMSGTLTTHLLLCHVNTTTVAGDVLIADALVFAAGALIILGRTEDSLAEQTITFGLIGAIVDGLRFGHLARRVLLDLGGRSQCDGNLGEIILDLGIFLESHIV